MLHILIGVGVVTDAVSFDSLVRSMPGIFTQFLFDWSLVDDRS